MPDQDDESRNNDVDETFNEADVKMAEKATELERSPVR